MSIKALFLDIDGTLVSFKTHRIQESTLEALRQAHDKGVRIYIATGRPMVLIENLSQIQQMDLLSGYVTMTGACCMDQGQTVFRMPMKREDVSRLWDYTTKRGITSIVIHEKQLCLNCDSKMLQDIFVSDLQVTTPMPVWPRKQAIEDAQVFQITAFLTQSQQDEIEPLLEDVEITRWHPGFVDINVRGCTKSRGIEAIIRKHGIDMSEVMAIGDGGNDMAMLRDAGIGVAMGNASPEVQAVADFVTTSVDEDGIAHALRHFGVI